ncbi:14.4 kDa HMG_Box/Yabby-like [Spodoptera frugiperda ascovirus 1a]|uniref:14.4 kDa HMG_Box/Yabby-like n=1 Tax=Spodoptera frugiperda ascovirus 1a TaxID=113370 RepID=Q0E510_SFAVA|nr:14.4 kDa HMG_Box/Yabby-like [Spodoptera frugiperda ascovirus 1a]CAL44691.1 14.4 kDa HMG_Box/Yabby-like [Spodoptera frugiperda ascovirus 1a]
MVGKTTNDTMTALDGIHQINSLVTSVFGDSNHINEWLSAPKQRSLNTILKRTMRIKNRRKRPIQPTAYNLFYKDQVPILSKEFPNITCRDIMKEAARRWNYLKQYNPQYLYDNYNYRTIGPQ